MVVIRNKFRTESLHHPGGTSSNHLRPTVITNDRELAVETGTPIPLHHSTITISNINSSLTTILTTTVVEGRDRRFPW